MDISVFHSICLDILARFNRPLRVSELYSHMITEYPEISETEFTKTHLRRYLLNSNHYGEYVVNHKFLGLKTNHFSFSYDSLDDALRIRLQYPLIRYKQTKLFDEDKIDEDDMEW